MITRLASIFGWGFLAAGILGFIPGVTMGGMLLGVFHVNTVHNLIHLVTGVAFLWAWSKGQCTAVRTFQVFGVVYGLVALWGLAQIGAVALGPVAINPADTVLHVVTSLGALYAGFLEPVRAKIHCHA